MATAKASRSSRTSLWMRGALVLLLLGGGVHYFYGEALAAHGAAGTSYAAKNACSCRFVGGRSLGSCEADFIAGMGAIFLSEDEQDRAVTASIPLLASTTATYQDGFGCQLEPWER